MKTFIVFSILFATVFAFPGFSADGDARIVQYDNVNDGVNPWHHSWELTNGIKNDVTGQIVRQGEEDESIAVRGTYSHIGPDGRTYIVDYVADDNGFQTRTH